MRLVTFEIKTPFGKVHRLGLWVAPQIVDLNLAYAGMLADKEETEFAQKLADVLLPSDMVAWFRAGDRGKEAARQVYQYWEDKKELHGPTGEQVYFSEDALHLLAPVPRPNTIRDFSTYEEHQKRATRAKGNNEVPEVWYRIPVYWKANPENTIGPGEDIHWPQYSQKLDFELEYGVYISKTGANIPLEQAQGYIGGYTIFNDISARDRQADETIMTFGPAKGKDFDTAKIMGPCLVTPDEFEGQSHRMTARIDGELWSEGETGGMYWSFAQLIAYISESETLKPGDFLGSGACATGCGLELNRWVQPGSMVELEIEGIGILKNRFVKH